MEERLQGKERRARIETAIATASFSVVVICLRTTRPSSPRTGSRDGTKKVRSTIMLSKINTLKCMTSRAIIVKTQSYLAKSLEKAVGSIRPVFFSQTRIRVRLLVRSYYSLLINLFQIFHLDGNEATIEKRRESITSSESFLIKKRRKNFYIVVAI